MANKITPFLVGTTCEVIVGDQIVMFAQNIDMRDTFSNQIPFGLGDFSGKSNEPLHYPGGTVSMSLLQYTDAVLGIPTSMSGVDGVTALETRGTNKIQKATQSKATDGNSIAFVESLSPAMLLFESTADIIIYAKVSNSGGKTESIPVYKAMDCLLVNYSENHSAASLSNISFSFRARVIQDMVNEADKDKNNA